MARDISKLKDKLHAVKGLDSSSAYNAEDEEEKKKKQAAQLKSQAQANAVKQALEKTRSGNAAPKYTTYEAPLKQTTEVQTRSSREAMPGKEKERATSGKSVTQSRKDQTTSLLANIGEALKANRSAGSDLQRQVSDLRGLTAGAANTAAKTGGWANEAAATGNELMQRWYESAGRQLTGAAASAQQRVNEMLSPASRQREVENENAFSRLLDYWTPRTDSTYRKQLTDEEKAQGSAQNAQIIAELEAKAAAGTADSTELYLLEVYKGIQKQYDAGEITERAQTGTEVEEAEASRLAAQHGYLQSRDNVNYLGRESERRIHEIFGRQTVPVVLDRMKQAGASVEDYEAEREALYQDYMNAGGLKTVFKKDYDLLNYTPEQYAAYRWTEENEPEKLDNLKEYLDISANAQISKDAQEYWSDPNRADGMNNIFGNTVLGITGRLSGLINTADIALQSLAVAGGMRNRVDYNRTGWGVQGGEDAVSAQAEKLAELGSLGDRFDGLKDTWLGDLNLGDLYRNGVDSAVSILNGAMFGAWTGAATSAQVYSGAFADAKERGASDKQVGLFAAFSSAAEGAGEQLSFGVFQKLIVSRGLDKKIGGKILLGLFQTAEEGGQELVTEELNILADKFIMQELSQEEQQAQAYMAQGYDPDTAREIAAEETNQRLIDAALCGIIGGAMRSGGAYAAQGISNAAGSVQTAIDDRARGRQIQEMGNAQQMAQLMSEVTGETVAPETNKRKLGKQQREFVENAPGYIEKADEATRDIVAGKVYDVANASVEALDGTSQAAKEKAGKRSAAMKTSDTGASVDGESVTVQGFVKTAEKGSDAKLNIKKADGTLAEADIADVTFDSKTADVYSYAADMATADLANNFRKSILPEQMGKIERVVTAYNNAYDMAKAGFKTQSIAESSLLKDENGKNMLTKAQFDSVIDLAKKARKSEQIATIAKAAERAKANMGNAWKGGKATFDDSVVVDALDDTQKAQIDMASVFTGSMGVNVEFFESKADETGRFTRENGSYNRRTNTIYIDVNAGRYYKGDSPSKTALLRTLSHEVTHAVQRNSPEIYAELRDTVTDILGDAKGVTIENLIDRKMAADSSLTTRDAAMDELVADACERMIEDSDAAQRLAEAHPEAAKTIFQKVGELLTKLKEAIKAAFKGRQLSTEAQLVMKDVERYQKMVDLWARGVMDTAEVSGREMGKPTDSEEMGVEVEEATSGEVVGLHNEPAQPAETHIDNRTWENVGERSVKAFMNEYRGVRAYMYPALQILRSDVRDSTRGERLMIRDEEGYAQSMTGQQRETTDQIAELKDRGYTWEQLSETLDMLENELRASGEENALPDTAIVKRIELALDDMLTNGYDSLGGGMGVQYAPDAEYIRYKAELPGAKEYAASQYEQADGRQFVDDVQFQARGTIERVRDLMAIHNITEEKLAAAMKLGGFPMPSIAIAKTSIGHQNFGPISLVFGRESIDPKVNRKNKVYSADAWTPTFPRIEYEANEKVERRIKDKLSGLKTRIDTYFANDLQRLLYDADDQLNRYGGEEGVINNAFDNYGLKAAYLEDTGRHAEVVTRAEERARKVSDVQAEIYTAIAELVGLDGLRSRSLGEIRNQYGAELEEIYPGSTKSAIRMARILSNVADYFENRNAAPEVVTVTDAEETRKAIDEAINAEAYGQWVRTLYAGIEGASGVYNGKEPYTASGNRRSFASTHYPVSVENIAKAMYDAYGGKMKNVSAHYNAKTMRAVTAKSFRSVDEMHKYESRMRARTQEEADALTNDLNSRLNALVSRIQNEHNAGREVSLYDQMAQADQIGAVLQEIAVKKFDAASIRNGLAAYGYQVSEQMAAELSTVIQEIAEMPVNIFEAKPERAVYFDEVKYAIVPDNMSSEVRSQLEQLVPDVREYTEGDEVRRLELLNERADLQFQAREYNDGIEMSKQDLALFYQKWGEIKAGSKAAFQRTSDGYYIFAINDKLVYTKGSYEMPRIDYVVEIAMEDETDIDSIRHLVFATERGEIYYEQARSILEDLFGKENVRGFDTVIHRTDARQNRRGKGTASREVYRGIEEKEVDSQNQTREEAISTRFVLANMLEADATNSEEAAWLRGYKGQLNELEMVLDAIEGNRQTVRELMFEEKTLSDGKRKLVMRKRTPDETERLKKAQNRIKILQEQVARMDEGLLNLENADVIRSLVRREEQKIRDREAEKRREGIAKVQENQRNAAIRKNIQRRAKRIDRMLRQPTDKEHIPEGLKGAMLEMMEIFVGDGPAFGGSKADVTRAYRAQQEYEAMRDNEDYSDLAGRYDEDTSERLKQLAKLMQEKDISKFNNAELTQLSMIIEHFEHLIRDQNDAFAQSRRKITEGYAEQIWQQTMTMKGRKENAINANALVKALKHMGHANVIPPYFFKHMGGAMGKLGNDLLKAEGRYGVNMNKAVARLAEIRDEYEHDKWATKKGDILKIETEIGDRLELTREQALGIWASAKRERLNTVQRATHLRDGGVILEKTARKLGIKGQEINVTPTKISQRDIQQIDKWLTDQQKQYADAMVGYISRDMAALGNETSMELAGYKKFGEGYYYPYKTSSDFRRTELGKVEDALIKNMGFTKSVTRGAKTPVVITDFSATVADHVNAMIMYNAFAAAQDQLMRVYDFKLDDSNSVKNLLRNAFGDEIPAYIEQLMRDLYGGVSPDRDAGLVNRLVSAHKKQAVLGSLSVVVQQPTALIRAMSQINPKYFVGQRAKGGFNEAMDYAGTAVIKDIGGFDSGVGRGATDWLNGSPKDWRNHAIKSGLDTVSDWAGLGAEYADKLAWMTIWKAVKREQAAKYKMDINSPELKEIAGERFDEVIRLTQVYDSVLTRSQLMRNKNVFWKGATSFMSEPTVTWNMMYDAAIEAFKNKKAFKGGGIVASVLVSVILTNLAKATVTAARDDDDEEATYLERYVKNAVEGLINDFVPFNYMPIVRDIYSKLQGYEVERADMGIINDILAAGEVILRDEKAPIDKVKSLVQLVSIMTGLPGKNIWREVEAAFNTAGAVPQSEARPGWLENALRTGIVDATPIGKWFKLTDSKANNADRMYEAIRDGDYTEAADLREHLKIYNGAKDDKAVDSLLRTRIKDGFTAGEIGADEAIEMLTGYAGMSDIKARDTVAEWKYTTETGEPYSKLKEQFLEGEITDDEAIAAMQEFGSAYEADAERSIAEWQYEKDTGRAWSDMKYDYISGEMTSEEVIAAQKKYVDAFEWDVKAQILKWDYERDKGRPYNEMKAAYIEGDITAKEAIADRVKYGGMNKEDAELDISKWNFEIDYGYPYDDMKDYYRLGRISKDKAIAARVKYGKQEQDEAYFAVTGWEYEQSEGKEWHGKFTKVHDAIDAGNDSALTKAIKEVYDHSVYEDGKKAASALTSNITSTYKPLYIEASEAERAQLEENLLEAYRYAYELAGEKYYGDSKKLKAIRKWLEEDE